MEKPSQEEIEKFMKVFDQLCQFEASQRVVRGNSCFEESNLPFSEVKKVVGWLKHKALSSDKDVLDRLITKYEKKADQLRIESASAQSKNDYISYSTLNEEAEIYEDIVGDLKAIGGLRSLKK